MKNYRAAMLMLTTVNGHTAVIDPNAVVAVWHESGKDWVAIAPGATVQVADGEAVVEQWLHLTGRGVTLPLDMSCVARKK